MSDYQHSSFDNGQCVRFWMCWNEWDFIITWCCFIILVIFLYYYALLHIFESIVVVVVGHQINANWKIDEMSEREKLALLRQATAAGNIRCNCNFRRLFMCRIMCCCIEWKMPFPIPRDSIFFLISNSNFKKWAWWSKFDGFVIFVYAAFARTLKDNNHDFDKKYLFDEDGDERMAKNVERWTEIIIFYISISVKKRHVFGAIFREFIFYPRDEVKQVY